MAVASSPTSSFTLRLAGPGDFDAYMDAFEAVAAEGRWLGAEAPLEREARRSGFDQAVAGDRAVLYLADAGPGAGTSGGIVGSIYASLARGVVDLGMFVVDGYRGGGVGSALLEAVIDWARQQRAHKISLAVWPTNHPAMGLYARYGFRIEGTRRRQHRRRSGGLWDSVLMGLVLDEEESPGGPGPAAAKPPRPPIVLPESGITGVLGGTRPEGDGDRPDVDGPTTDAAASGAGASGERPAGDGLAGQVVLREWHASDIPALVAAIAGLEGREWLPLLPYPYTAEDAAEHITRTRVRLAAGTAAELAVVVDGSLAGAVGLSVHGSDAGIGEIGYWVAAGARRRGVASTAARLLSDFGFEMLGLRRIELHAAVANTASRRVAEKAGFELEGIRRALLMVRGVPTDHALYSRIADR